MRWILQSIVLFSEVDMEIRFGTHGIDILWGAEACNKSRFAGLMQECSAVNFFHCFFSFFIGYRRNALGCKEKPLILLPVDPLPLE